MQVCVPRASTSVPWGLNIRFDHGRWGRHGHKLATVVVTSMRVVDTGAIGAHYHPSGPAQQHLQPGDRIMSLNGARVRRDADRDRLQTRVRARRGPPHAGHPAPRRVHASDGLERQGAHTEEAKQTEADAVGDHTPGTDDERSVRPAAQATWSDLRRMPARRRRDTDAQEDERLLYPC